MEVKGQAKIGNETKIHNYVKIRPVEKKEQEKALNIILVGGEGSGKSTVANVLAGSELFEEKTHTEKAQKIEKREFL